MQPGARQQIERNVFIRNTLIKSPPIPFYYFRAAAEVLCSHSLSGIARDQPSAEKANLTVAVPVAFVDARAIAIDLSRKLVLATRDCPNTRKSQRRTIYTLHRRYGPTNVSQQVFHIGSVNKQRKGQNNTGTLFSTAQLSFFNKKMVKRIGKYFYDFFLVTTNVWRRHFNENDLFCTLIVSLITLQ